MDVLKDDVRSLASDVTRRAQDHLVEPAKAAARDAKSTVQDAARNAMSTATTAARSAMDQARGFMNKHANQAEKAASQQWDRASRWITQNPFSAMGVAFAAGLVFSAITSKGSRR
jgi:ElaB/YqjD/DUF883 family membrane-anchored ribosome-binding protein